MMRDELRTHLNRRGFLLGAASLTLGAAIAGCGGGSDNEDDDGTIFPDDRYEGTYQYFTSNADGNGTDAAASITIDRKARATFWTLFTSESSLSDFGQLNVNSEGYFEQIIDGVRTIGRVQGSVIEGRTEYTSSGQGFDWQAQRISQQADSRPPTFLTGSFAGDEIVDGVRYYTLLGVSRDGNATIFGAFDAGNDNNVEYYYYEGTSFNADGNVESSGDYFLDLYGDRLALRDNGTDDSVKIEFEAGDSLPDIGVSSGETVDFHMDFQSLGRVQRNVVIPRSIPAMQRAAERLRQKKQ